MPWSYSVVITSASSSCGCWCWKQRPLHLSCKSLFRCTSTKEMYTKMNVQNLSLKHISKITFSWVTLKMVVPKVFTKNSLTCFKQTPNLVHLPFEIIQYICLTTASVSLFAYIFLFPCAPLHWEDRHILYIRRMRYLKKGPNWNSWDISMPVISWGNCHHSGECFSQNIKTRVGDKLSGHKTYHCHSLPLSPSPQLLTWSIILSVSMSLSLLYLGV